MLRFLPVVVEVALLVYCLVDCIQTDSLSVRNLSKTTWIVLIVLVPVVGGVAWLVAGRPTRTTAAPRVPWPSTATSGFPEHERPRPPRGPDDDPAFLAGLGGDPEKEKILRDWEAQLREREARLRGDDADEPSADGESQPDERR